MNGGRSDKKVVLITGGNSGIGFECARSLAQSGWRVVMASRDRERARQAVATLTRESGNPAIEEMVLDLGSQRSVRRFVQEFRERKLLLRALVCNAGVQVVSGRTFTEDGNETTFAVNHLGHFLLTNLLLDELSANAPARIVVVASGVHDPKMKTGMPKPSYTDFEGLAMRDVSEDAPYNGRLAYVNSKLCNMLFTYELARRLSARGLSTNERSISVNVFEPGLVPGSGLARDYSPVARLVWNRMLPVLSRFMRTVNSPTRAGSALAGIVLDPAL